MLDTAIPVFFVKRHSEMLIVKLNILQTVAISNGSVKLDKKVVFERLQDCSYFKKWKMVIE